MRDEPGRVLALDVGGTKIAAAIVQGDGAVECFEREAAGAHEGPEPMIARLLSLARRTLAGADGPKPDVVGIGVGGPLDRLSGVVSPHNNPGWRDVLLGPIVARALALPVHLDNDANAAALGEWRFGAGRGHRNVVYMTLSTGVGGGAIVDGRLVRGATGNAAELGHTKVERDGRRCLCGSRGCLEAYASGPAIARRAREAIANGWASSLPADDLTAEQVVAAAATGDEAARHVWEETVELLAIALASIAHAFDPERIVLGGGVTSAGPLLFEPLAAALPHQLMAAFVGRVDVVPAALGERVGVVGAAAVATTAREAGEPGIRGNA